MVKDDLEAREIRFSGTPCCLFSRRTIGDSIWDQLETLKDYGSEYRSPDGKVRHRLYVWDEGHRTLKRCARCGALFLVQSSEYHSFDDGSDDRYTDLYQVDDEATAELINATWGGFELERRYRAPHIAMTNDRCTFSADGR